MSTGLTCVGYGWTVLSLTATVCVAAGFYLPYWLIGEIHFEKRILTAYFGSFRRCNYPTFDTYNKQLTLTEQCARYSTFADIPSLFWRVSTVAVAVGVCLSVLLVFIALPACCMRDIVSRTSALLMGICQVVAAVCIGFGCIIFPLGWDNKEVFDACGPRSDQYLLGNCTIGWSFYLLVGGAVLLLLCASLSTKSGKPIEWKRYPKIQVDEEQQEPIIRPLNSGTVIIPQIVVDQQQQQQHQLMETKQPNSSLFIEEAPNVKTIDI